MSRYSEEELPVKYVVVTNEGNLQHFEDTCNMRVAAGWRPIGGVSTTWAGYLSEGNPVIHYSQAFTKGLE